MPNFLNKIKQKKIHQKNDGLIKNNSLHVLICVTMSCIYPVGDDLFF